MANKRKNDDVNLRVELDRHTDAGLRDWAKLDERSKRSLARIILRNQVRAWQEQRKEAS